MASWDFTEVAPGLPIKSAHMKQASNDWQGDVDANGNMLEDLTRATERVVAVSYSATPTFNAALGCSFTITLTGDVSSSTLSNAKAGQTVRFKITQDGTGGRAFTWPENVLGGMTIDSGAAAGEIAVQEFHCFDGANYEAISMGAIR